MNCATETRTALYRFYDARETLLYVGITNDPWRRWRDHVQEKPWYPQVKHQAVTWYDSEPEARSAETRAIRNECPRFNIAGAVRPPEAHSRLTFEVVIRICAIWACIPGLLGCLFIVLAINIPIHSAGAVYVHALGWVLIPLTLSMPVPFMIGALVFSAPQVYRFGCWLNRNFGDQAHERSAAARPEPIPLSFWLLAPRQTFRLQRTMTTTGQRDYRQALAALIRSAFGEYS